MQFPIVIMPLCLKAKLFVLGLLTIERLKCPICFKLFAIDLLCTWIEMILAHLSDVLGVYLFLGFLVVRVTTF